MRILQRRLRLPLDAGDRGVQQRRAAAQPRRLPRRGRDRQRSGDDRRLKRRWPHRDRRRSASRRCARAMLKANHADVWVASASAGGPAHLVPLSFAWDGHDVIIALKESSPTARNIVAASEGAARVRHDASTSCMVDADCGGAGAGRCDTRRIRVSSATPPRRIGTRARSTIATSTSYLALRTGADPGVAGEQRARRPHRDARRHLGRRRITGRPAHRSEGGRLTAGEVIDGRPETRMAPSGASQAARGAS